MRNRSRWPCGSSGWSNFKNGDLDAAGRHFTELLTTGKFVDDSFYYLGLIAERRADLEKALRLYAQVQSGDNAAAALLRASTILQTHGAAAAAQEILDHLIEDEPARAPEVLAARAKIYSDAGDARQALAVLDRGREQYPDSVDLRYAIATTDEEAGHVGAALRELKQVLKLRPDDPAALNAYGYTLADHNRQLARARAAHRARLRRGSPQCRDSGQPGLGALSAGSRRAGAALSGRCATPTTAAPISAPHYGEVLWQLGRRTEADQVWAEVGAHRFRQSPAECHAASPARLRSSVTCGLGSHCSPAALLLAGCADPAVTAHGAARGMG